MDDQDRQDRLMLGLLGDNLMAGTLRLFLLIGVISAVGGVVAWLLARS